MVNGNLKMYRLHSMVHRGWYGPYGVWSLVGYGPWWDMVLRGVMALPPTFFYHTDTCKNITFPQLRLRALITLTSHNALQKIH